MKISIKTDSKNYCKHYIPDALWCARLDIVGGLCDFWDAPTLLGDASLNLR